MRSGGTGARRGRKSDLRILVIHGPNLNLLGLREKSIYGDLTLEEINQKLEALAVKLGVDITIFQSNSENEIIEKIQDGLNTELDGLLINPAAFGHTSIAIRDAILASRLPMVEVHMSNIYQREEFRHKTYLSDIASGVVIGFSAKSYELGLIGLVNQLDKQDEGDMK